MINNLITTSQLVTPGQTRLTDMKPMENAYNRAEANLGPNFTDTQLDDILSYLIVTGVINPNEKALQNNAAKLKDAIGHYRDGNFMDTLQNTLNFPDTDQSIIRVLNAVANYGANFKDINLDDLDKYMSTAGGSSGPDIVSIPTPTYLGYDIDHETIPVHYAHLLSGQEMADLHQLNIDPQYYYDLVKQGTSANVGLQNYLDAQAQNASTYNDLKEQVSYLDAIRNSKSEAMAKGVSAGAQAAQEVLNTVNANNAYTNNYAENISNRGQAYNDVLYADASAHQTADSIFGNLMRNVINGSLNYYSDDVNREGQDQITRAGIYGADRNTLANRYRANQDLYSAYIQSVANSNYANSQAGGTFNELSRLLNIFKESNNGNVKDTVRDFMPVILGGFYNTNKYGNAVDYFTALKNRE